MLIQLFFVLVAIIIGARLGGIGLGVLGGAGLAILTFGFGLTPTAPPIDVMLMIVAVISAASCMQAAGGLDLMVKWAEKLLRKNPQQITILSPLVTYFFTLVAGTGHVAYSVLPVIAEVATETKIRPERPLAIAVIASQQAITASPISAATVALLSMLSCFGISLMDILLISIPSTLTGVLVGALYSLKAGKELEKDPEYLRRLANGDFNNRQYKSKEVQNHTKALWSVILFLAATVGIVLFGSHMGEMKDIPRHSWLFLVLSGAATGLSWLFYFKALQTGDVSRVAPIDKLSVVITICLSFLFLKEPLSPKVILGAALITCGSIIMLLK